MIQFLSNKSPASEREQTWNQKIFMLTYFIVAMNTARVFIFHKKCFGHTILI